MGRLLLVWRVVMKGHPSSAGPDDPPAARDRRGSGDADPRTRAARHDGQPLRADAGGDRRAGRRGDGHQRLLRSQEQARGARESVSIGGSAQPSDLAPLEHAPGVVAYSGPFPMTWALLQSGHTSATAEVEGRSSAPSAVDRPKLIQGTWVRPGGVVVEATFAQVLGLHVGDRVESRRQLVRGGGDRRHGRLPHLSGGERPRRLPGGQPRFQQHRSRVGACSRRRARRGRRLGARLLHDEPEARRPRRRPGVRRTATRTARRAALVTALLAEHPEQGHARDRPGAAGPLHGELAARAPGDRECGGARRRSHGRADAPRRPAQGDRRHAALCRARAALRVRARRPVRRRPGAAGRMARGAAHRSSRGRASSAPRAPRRSPSRRSAWRSRSLSGWRSWRRSCRRSAPRARAPSRRSRTPPGCRGVGHG